MVCVIFPISIISKELICYYCNHPETKFFNGNISAAIQRNVGKDLRLSFNKTNRFDIINVISKLFNNLPKIFCERVNKYRNMP